MKSKDNNALGYVNVTWTPRHPPIIECLFRPEKPRNLAIKNREKSKNSIFLSDREQEVLVHLFKGNSTKEIANELFISHHTVESHRKNLLHKFEAKNSVHLIYLALQKGLLYV